MLRRVGGGGKRGLARLAMQSYPGLVPMSKRHFQSRCVFYNRRKPKHSALAALLQPKREPQNAEPDFGRTTVPVIPDFDDPSGADDPSGRHGFFATRATRTAARPLAFWI